MVSARTTAAWATLPLHLAAGGPRHSAASRLRLDPSHGSHRVPPVAGLHSPPTSRVTSRTCGRASTGWIRAASIFCRSVPLRRRICAGQGGSGASRGPDDMGCWLDTLQAAPHVHTHGRQARGEPSNTAGLAPLPMPTSMSTWSRDIRPCGLKGSKQHPAPHTASA